MEKRAKTGGDEDGEGCFVGTEMCGGGFGLHGFDVDEIGVVVVEDEELGVPLAAGDDETASLVGENFACGRDGGGVTEMGALAGRTGRWEQDGVEEVVVGEICAGGGFGGALILPSLIEVALVHGDWVGRKLGEAGWIEAGELYTIFLGREFECAQRWRK